MAEATDLVLERILDAPRDLVWKAWTGPEHLKRWWAPKPNTVHFAVRMAALKSMRVVGSGVRGRNG